MTASGTVLVTGSAGCIGRAAVRALVAAGFPVRGFDRVPTPGTPDAVVGSLTDVEAVRRAVRGAETVIHLAATPDDDDFLAKLVPNNIVGVYHVMEEARQAGVGRLILASSGQVTYHQRTTGPLPIHVTDPPTPRGWYAATKVFVEAAGRAFADTYPVTVLAVRLGWCPRSAEHARELETFDWGPDVYLSPGDAGRFFVRAVQAPRDVRFAVLYAVSRPVRRTVVDLGPSKELLGYEPQDQWPGGLDPSWGIT